jgi:hypothetical protein
MIQKISTPFARFAIFAIYFWFGLLKLIGESPASPMVKTLFGETMGKMFQSLPFAQFMILFALFEMLIGVSFLIPKLDKLSFVLLALHLVTTTMPLFLLSGMIWTKPWVPTLEGQYIIKNLAIIGLALSIANKRYV